MSSGRTGGLVPEIKKKSALEDFLERLYRLRTYKNGDSLSEHFIILDEPMEIGALVEKCKKYCNNKGMRFMGVFPLFEKIDLEYDGR